MSQQSQVHWKLQAQQQWDEASRHAPHECDSVGEGNYGPTKQEIFDEANWFDDLRLEKNEFQNLGEDRGDPNHRIFISELSLLYEFVINIAAMRVDVKRFVNLYHRSE